MTINLRNIQSQICAQSKPKTQFYSCSFYSSITQLLELCILLRFFFNIIFYNNHVTNFQYHPVGLGSSIIKMEIEQLKLGVRLQKVCGGVEIGSTNRTKGTALLQLHQVDFCVSKSKPRRKLEYIVTTIRAYVSVPLYVFVVNEACGHQL